MSMEPREYFEEKIAARIEELRAASDAAWPSVREELEADLAALNQALEPKL